MLVPLWATRSRFTRRHKLPAAYTAHRCTAPLAGPTPASSFTFAGRNHYAYSAMLTWPAARDYCRGQLQDLVTITSAAHNKAVYDAMAGFGANFQIGGSDAEQEGQWRWSDGTAWGAYSNWNAGEPNNDGEEDCAIMWVNVGDANGTWNDAPCDLARPFVCADGAGEPAVADASHLASAE